MFHAAKASIKIILLITTVLGFSQAAFADTVSTTCEKWIDESWSTFDCSNEKTYVIRKAICTTIDTRRNGDGKTTEGPKPEELFCAHRFREDLKRCTTDGVSDTIACHKEYLESKNAKPRQKPSGSAGFR